MDLETKEDLIDAPVGHFLFELIDETGKVVETHEAYNRVVTVGKQLVLDRLFGLSTASSIAGMAVGTSATPSADGDTTITGAVFKAFDAAPVRTGLSVVASTTFGTSEANIAIREVGLLTASGGVLFNRIAPTAAIDKTSALSLKITLTITMS